VQQEFELLRLDQFSNPGEPLKSTDRLSEELGEGPHGCIAWNPKLRPVPQLMDRATELVTRAKIFDRSGAEAVAEMRTDSREPLVHPVCSDAHRLLAANRCAILTR